MYEKNLDYFRGLFAFLVLILHINQIFFYPIYFDKSNFFIIFDNIGAYSVLGFLLISGYSISNSLFNNYNKFGYINIQYYLKRRILRIYPPLIGAIILMVIIYNIIKYFNMHGFESYRLVEDLYIAREKFDLNFSSLLQMLVFLPRAVYTVAVPSSNGPLWSLSLEVWYYFLVLLLFLQIYSKSAILKVTSFSILILIFYFQMTHEGYINRQFLYLFLVFIIGVVCSYYVNSKKSISIKILNYTLILLVFASLFFLFYYGLNIVRPYNDDLHYIFMVINSAIMMFVYVLYIHNKKLFFQNFFVDISKYSYSLYIIHFPILLFLFSLFHSKLINYGFLELIFVGVMLLYVVIKFSKYFSFIFERNYFGK